MYLILVPLLRYFVLFYHRQSNYLIHFVCIGRYGRRILLRVTAKFVRYGPMIFKLKPTSVFIFSSLFKHCNVRNRFGSRLQYCKHNLSLQMSTILNCTLSNETSSEPYLVGELAMSYRLRILNKNVKTTLGDGGGGATVVDHCGITAKAQRIRA